MELVLDHRLAFLGKSTLARALRQRLAAREQDCVLLDGDEVRLRSCLRWATPTRTAPASTLRSPDWQACWPAKGHIVLVPATAYKCAYREEARRLARASSRSTSHLQGGVRRRDPKGTTPDKITFPYEQPRSRK